MIRALFLVLFGAVVLSVFVLVIGGRRHGPDYSGDSFSVWIKRAGPNARVDEAVALGGSGLVDELVALVDWQPSRTERVSRRLFDALPDSWQPSFRLLELSDPEVVRRQAFRSLGGLGEEAATALPIVLTWTRAPGETGGEALTAALRIAPTSPEVHATVVTALLDENASRREQAAQALVRAEVPVENGLLALLDGLNRPEPVTPTWVEAFGVYGPSASSAVPRLVPLLTNPELKPSVLTTLRRIGPASASVLDELKPDMTADSPVIVEVLDLVAVLGPAAGGVLPQLRALDDNPAPMIRLLAAAARGRMGVDVPSVVNTLAQEVRFQIPDRSLGYFLEYPGLREVRLTPAQAAAWWLGQLGEQAKPAVPDLIATLRSDDPRLMMLSAWSLWRISQEAEFVVPAIRAGLRFTADPVTQLFAVAAATELGPLGALLEPELTEIQSLNLSLRRAAKEAQERISSGSAVPMP